MLDSLVRVSRRVNENHFVKIANAQSSETPVTNRDTLQNFVLQSHAQTRRPTSSLAERIVVIPQAVHSMTSGYKFQLISLPIDLPSASFLPRNYLILTYPSLQRPLRLASKCDRLYETPELPSQPTQWICTTRITGFQRFPLNNFKYFLTLFSKFFSSFPHGTCSLSVSRRYLALDEIYHPFRTALPSYSTLWTHVVSPELPVKDGILTLYDTLFQKIYTQVTADKRL